jgi:hypothetical protein
MLLACAPSGSSGSSLRAATLLCVVRLCIARDEQFSCCVGCVGCVSCVSHVETYFYVLPQEQVARDVGRRFASFIMREALLMSPPDSSLQLVLRTYILLKLVVTTQRNAHTQRHIRLPSNEKGLKGLTHERVNRYNVTMDALLIALATEDAHWHCRVDDVNALTCSDLETILVVDDLVGEYAAELRIVRVVEEPRVGCELATDWTVIRRSLRECVVAVDVRRLAQRKSDERGHGWLRLTRSNGIKDGRQHGFDCWCVFEFSVGRFFSNFF